MNVDDLSLRWKFAIGLGLAIVLVLANVTTVFVFISQLEDDGQAIDRAGRQRMLTQEMVKNALQIASGNVDKRESLRAAAAAYNQSLEMLIHGDQRRGIPEPPPEVRSQLLETKQVWEPFNEQLQVILTADPDSQRFQTSLTNVQQTNEELLQESNTAVHLYQKAYERKVLHMQFALIGLLLLDIGVIAVIGREVNRRIISNVERVAIEAEQIAAGDLDHEISDVAGNDEIGQVIRAIRSMKGSLVDSIAEADRLTEELDENLIQLQVMDRVLRHNLHNAMNIIQGYAETLQETHERDVAEQAEIIVEESEQLLATVDKQREITKMLGDPQLPEPTDLQKVIDDVVAATREQYPDAQITVEGSADRLVRATASFDQAFTELLTNAVTHSDQAKPSIEVTVEDRDDTVAIRIADDGPGIPEMEQKIITEEAEIEPLYHGSGLGLWLVKLIVKKSGGSLAFDENEPRGSIVTVRLPTAPVQDGDE